MTRRSWVPAAIGGIVLAAMVAAVGLLLLRPMATASVASITVACDGIGSEVACERWAADLLAAGPGIHTFDPDDLAHLRLVRPFLLPGECEAEYFVGRSADAPVARETVACPQG